MRPFAEGSVRALALALLMLTAAPWLRAAQITFRATTDVVYVTATVLGADGHLVTDLAKEDFQVRADDVPREISVFNNEQLPFAASIWFDISPSDVGSFPLMAASMSELVRHFGPGDRANVGSFNGLPSMTSRFTANPRMLSNWVNASLGGEGAPCFAAALDRGAGAVTGSWSSTATAAWSAIACGVQALAGDSETPRHVIVMVTDGFDNASGIDERQAEQLANEHGVMIYVIAVAGVGGVNRPDLEALADHTGGGYLAISGFDNLAPAFAQVADELRHQYVIGFPPSSATADTHHITITVRRPDVHVRFRRAYATSQPRPAVAPLPDMSAAVVNQPLAITTTAVELTDPAMLEQLDRFIGGDSSVASRRFGSRVELRDALKTLRNAAPVWINAAAPDVRPRRRLAVAAYTLDLITSQPDALWEPIAFPISSVLDWTRSVLDEGPPSAPERIWYSAAAGLLERFEPRQMRVDRLSPILRLVEDGERRFPDDPWWALERALDRELQSWPDGRDGPPPPRASDVATAIELYARAAQATGVRSEAEIRTSFLILRRARLLASRGGGESIDTQPSAVEIADAQSHLDAAGTPDTPELRYLLNLFRGIALARAGRLPEAIVAFRAAFSAAPYAQSATVALGAALAESGQNEQAAALLSRMWDFPRPPFDPWLFYPFPHYQDVDPSRDRLHAALKP